MKKFLVGIILILVVLMVGIYNSVNAEVPKDYKLDGYKLNDEVILDETSLKVNSYKVYERDIMSDGDNHIELILKVTVKNITQDVINLKNVLTNSKVSYKTYYQDYSEVFGDFSKIKSLEPQESVDLDINFLLFRNEMNQLGENGELKFYPPKSSFENQIISEFKDGYLYGKYIKLGE